MIAAREPAEERTAREKFLAWLREIEAEAAEIVEIGDPALQRRYQLYTRVKAALALPKGPERIAALQAAKIDDRMQH